MVTLNLHNLSDNPFDYPMDYTPKKPITPWKIQSLKNNAPLDSLPDGYTVDDLYYDTYYECYIVHKDDNGLFYYQSKWSQETMPSIMSKRIAGLDGIIKI